jgi:LmbE family N-acetylglucosaminyl deacetylase
MKALCLVAHPDDCVIFAYSYIHNHPEHKWTICYLTYNNWDQRGKEMSDFWRKRNISCVFMGYTDDYRDIENKKISFNEEQARRELGNIAADYDLVLTHDEHGDYGHIHHVFVHDCVKHHPNLVTFARPGEGTTYTIPAGTYSLDEFPQHREIIAGFHSTEHQNSYKEHKCI